MVLLKAAMKTSATIATCQIFMRNFSTWKSMIRDGFSGDVGDDSPLDRSKFVE